MNIGNALISSILDTRDIRQAITGGLSEELFDPENAIYWELIRDHYDKHSEVPSLDHMKRIAPQFKFVKPEDSFSALLLEAKTQHLGQAIQKGIVHISNTNGFDPWKAREVLVSLTEKILIGHQTDNTLTKVGSDIDVTLKEIEVLRKGDGVIGIPWPWKFLHSVDAGAQGFCPGELYYLYGREACGKTFFNLWLALWFWSQGRKVLFFTRESEHSFLKWRIIALSLKLDMSKIMKASFNEKEMEELIDFHEKVATSNRWYTSEVAEGITGFKSVVEQINPDVIIHDYFKAMADDAMDGKVQNQHSYVATVIDQIKTFAVAKKIPVIITGHANRKGVDSSGKLSDELAWSDHIIRRCDFVIRMITCNDTHRSAFIFNKARAMKPNVSFTFDAGKCSTYGNFISKGSEWVLSMKDKKKDQKDSSDDFVKGDFKF